MWTPENWYLQARDNAQKTADLIRNRAELMLGVIAQGKPAGMPLEEALQEMEAFHQQRLAAVPDLFRYPELRGMRELIDAEWRGTRDGAGLDDRLLASYYTGYVYYSRCLHAGIPELGCTYIYFPTSEYGPLLANNLDSSPAEKFGPPHWPALNEHLLIGGVSSGIFMDEQSPEIFPVPVEKLVARYCRTTDEAAEMMTRYNHFWGPGNKIVVDRNHRVAMIEKSACRIGVRFSPDGFGFIASMTAEEPGMHAYLNDRRTASLKARKLPEVCEDTLFWEDHDLRRQELTEMLDEARKNPTLETLRRMIQFREPGKAFVCVNGEKLLPDSAPGAFTLRTTIWVLNERRALWWAKEGETPSFENRKPDVRFPDVRFPDVLEW